MKSFCNSIMLLLVLIICKFGAFARDGVQTFARALRKSHVQTSAVPENRTQASSLNGALIFIFLHLRLIRLSVIIIQNKVKVKSHYEPKRPTRQSFNQVSVLLLPFGWDASPSQGYPQYMFITG